MLMQDMVNATRRLAYGGMSEQLNILATDYTPGSGVLKFEIAVENIQPGMPISSGLNVWWVKSVVAATNEVYVIPSYDGSPDLPVSAGSTVFLRPRATDWLLFSSLNDVIVSLSSRTQGLYHLGTELIPQWNSIGVYPLYATGVDSVLAVRVNENVWGGGWKTLMDREWRWVPERNELRILDQERVWGREIEVLYRRPFQTAQALTDDLLADCGLPEDMQDIPPLGAAANLLLTTDARRNQVTAQVDPRRSDEVPAGANSSVSREMRRRFIQRVEDERVRLLNRNPYKVSL